MCLFTFDLEAVAMAAKAMQEAAAQRPPSAASVKPSPPTVSERRVSKASDYRRDPIVATTRQWWRGS
jgi:hypothetical protein